MTEELCRAKFEKWWERTEHNGNPPRFGWGHYRDGISYSDDEFQSLWSAYQAAWNTRAEMEKSDG